MEKMTRDEIRKGQLEIWAGHIERQRQSGKTIKGYCTEAGLKVWQFCYWRKAIEPKSQGTGFMEVKIRAGGGIAVEVAGCRILVEAGFDPALLREVMAAVRAA